MTVTACTAVCLAAYAIALAPGCRSAERDARATTNSSAITSAPSEPPRRPLDVTFFVAADTHLGFDTPDRERDAILKAPLGIEITNLTMIDHMNTLPGKPWPAPIGGNVAAPRGVLIAGDLTEDGGKVDWNMFEALYGSNGPLAFPVYEGDGNHDRNRDWFVREEIARRHGGRYYSFDFDGLHLVCLAEAPDDDGLSFLEKDLQALPPDTPVIAYLHYPLAGAFAENNWFGRGDFRDRLETVLRGHRILALFHGHRHSSGAYRWRGHDVYHVGSPKHGWRSFAVVRVTDEQLRVASWNYELSAFWWWHQKPLVASGPSETFGSIELPEGQRRPSLLLDR